MITIERTQNKEKTTQVRVFKDDLLILDELAPEAETNDQAHTELEEIIRAVQATARALGAEVSMMTVSIVGLPGKKIP